MGTKPKYNNASNEKILQHFILAILVFIEATFKVLNLIIPNPKSGFSDASKGIEPSLDDLNIKDFPTRLVAKKNKEEMKSILNSVDITSNLNNNQLSSLILNNPEAIQKMLLEERRKELSQTKNSELRHKLQGMQGISRLKKSELIEMVLNEEALKKENDLQNHLHEE